MKADLPKIRLPNNYIIHKIATRFGIFAMKSSDESFFMRSTQTHLIFNE